MRKDEALRILSEASPEIVSRFGVKQLRLFGSTARDEAREDSDVDVLVEFEGPATFRGYFDLLHFLEDRLGVSVDLVTEKGLKERVRPYVEKDSIHVACRSQL
jgi:predicted nucleotidyltransferase